MQAPPIFGIHLLNTEGYIHKKSRIRETKNLSTDADSRTDTISEGLRDLSQKKKKKKEKIKEKNLEVA